MEKEGSRFERKTYVITGAQGIQNPYSAEHYGRDSSKGEVNAPLLRTIEYYVKKNEGELEICAIPGAYINEIEIDSFFHKREDVYMEKNARGRLERQKIKEERLREAKGGMHRHFFWNEIPETNYKITGKRLNSNVTVLGIPEPSQNKDPLVGKNVFTKKYGGGSIIIPSTKQKLQPVAIGQAGNYPRLKISSGCVTKPNYNTTNRTGFLANEAHEYGFCVIDVLDNKLYLPRLVPAQDNGTFIDLGIKYVDGKSPQRIGGYTLVLGDSHASELDPLTDEANNEMISYFSPSFIHLHDVFNARCINLHEIDNECKETSKLERGVDSLEEELRLTGEYIAKKAKISGRGKILVNYSNHDDMLYRWLALGKYSDDKKNRRIAHKILSEYNEGNSVLELALNIVGHSYKNVRFLKLGEDAIYWGYQCGMHGHKGKNGAKGSLKTLMEEGKIIMGHVHQLEVNQGSISVGTSSKIPLDYQLGQPSTSMAGNAIIYEGGLAQAIPIIKGKWRK
jgi:hypothetical protein